MILYRTPDGRPWLYGGERPVGITSGLAAKVALVVPDVGAFTWAEHSELWAATLADVTLDSAALAIVHALADAYGTAPTAEQVAALVRALLTHPG